MRFLLWLDNIMHAMQYIYLSEFNFHSSIYVCFVGCMHSVVYKSIAWTCGTGLKTAAQIAWKKVC